MKKKLFGLFRSHRKTGIGLVIIVVIAIIYIARSLGGSTAATQYVIATVRRGSIVQTVTGSGQVSASHQLDITGKASGTISNIYVKVGDHVSAGQLLAKLDTTDAAIALSSAELAMQKLTAPAKDTDIRSAENNLSKSYVDAYNSISSTYLDLPSIIAGMKDLLYGRATFLSDQEASHLIPTAQAYRSQAGMAFDKANDEYSDLLLRYKSLSRQSSTSTIETMLSDTYNMTRDIATALQYTQNTITYVSRYQPEYLASSASAAAANVNSWSSSANSDLSSLLASKNSISSYEDALNTLIDGADILDIQSQKLSLQQAQNTYDNYFVRAPFDGIVGRIPVNTYDQAGSGTVIVTLIGDDKMATISLNEIDAAKIKVGQNAELTFDAIEGLNATGTVSEVDLVGTVNQGVVSYNVKISVNTNDPRILPGMSVNATIITKRDDGVLVVPSSAIKTSGNTRYVEVIDNPPLPMTASTSRAANNSRQNITGTTDGSDNASSTRPIRSMYNGAGTGASYGSVNFNNSGIRSASNITVSPSTAPRNVNVVIGDADDNNTAIASGLKAGEWVVTRTITGAGTTAQTSQAPSILNSLGGSSRSSAGALRATIGH